MPAQPGCLVLDVRMPGMSGLDLQAELARRGAELPTIVVTGHAEVPMAVRAVKAGAIDFIEKPFSDQLLLDRVRQALEIDRQAREVRGRREEARQRLAALTATRARGARSRGRRQGQQGDRCRARCEPENRRGPSGARDVEDGKSTRWPS